MAVPSSGAIRMVGIYSEFNESDYTSFYPEETPISLTDLSTEGDDTQPQAFTFNKGNFSGIREFFVNADTKIVDIKTKMWMFCF